MEEKNNAQKLSQLVAEVTEFKDKLNHLLNLQISTKADPKIQSIAFLDWLDIEQVAVITQTKAGDHLKKLLASVGVESRPVQGYSQGPGVMLRYSKKDILEKVIVNHHDYKKMNLKKSI